jgi:hypothetical protein
MSADSVRALTDLPAELLLIIFGHCEDTLEIVLYTNNSCTDIATNKRLFWVAAFPPNAPDLHTQNKIPPFSLPNQMGNNPQVTIYYVFGSDFELTPCGTTHLNITLSRTDSGYSMHTHPCPKLC